MAGEEGEVEGIGPCLIIYFPSGSSSLPTILARRCWTLELYHTISLFPSPYSMLENATFFNKKGKDHLIITIVSGGRGECACSSNFFFFVWDYRMIHVHGGMFVDW